MKKTLFTLGCALFAAVGLTCCGGGGSGSQIYGKKYNFRAPTIEGHMVMTVSQTPKPGNPTIAGADFFFGNGTFTGTVIVEDDKDDPLKTVLKISIDGGQDVGNDNGFQAFFADFLGDDFDANTDTLTGVPAATLTIKFDNENKWGGTYDITFTVEVENNGVTTEEEVTDQDLKFFREQ